MTTGRRIIFLFGTLMALIVTQIITKAQDQPPAPQFLYRRENHLVLLDGYTGKESVLPLEVNERDLFKWSPDGEYLMARLYQEDYSGYCLNLYDVVHLKWFVDKPISCTVQEALFSDDGSQIFYSSNDKTNGTLSIYHLKDKNIQDIYKTKNRDSYYPDGISALNWTPTKNYLTFEHYTWIMGGTLNSLVILNIQTQKYVEFSAPDTYYASYYPVWSADDHWFLISLQDAYVTSGTLPMTNEEGDVYLAQSDTGKKYRLTYTPAESEVDIHWTEDGQIAFTEVSIQKYTFSIEQAMKVKSVPDDQIIYPEAVDPQDIFDPLQGVIVSPDSELGAWTTETEKKTFILNIGSVFGRERVANFSISISDPYKLGAVLIGWRPSNFSYPRG